jgi:hypothetical protein
MQFKYALVARALARPRELIELCSSAAGLAALWDAIGRELPEAERCDGSRLAVRQLGDASRPVVMIALPPPERPNEAYLLCAVPAAAYLKPDGSLFIPDPADELALRMFGLERSVLPDGGLIGFVVEWTASARLNYDAPDNASPGALWKAILEIFGGARSAIHSIPFELGDR